VVGSGRPFTPIDGDDDVNRPFLVTGAFADAELVSLVRFVRSSPSGPTPLASAPTGPVRGDWPIVSISRSRDVIDVRLRKDDSTFQQVELRPEGSAWVVARIGLLYR
jgi:hypothetical protein